MNSNSKQKDSDASVRSSDRSVCSGCGKPPVDIGNMGRHKLVCSSYHARSPETTVRCIGGQGRSMWLSESAAVVEWNSMQTNVKLSDAPKPAAEATETVRSCGAKVPAKIPARRD